MEGVNGNGIVNGHADGEDGDRPAKKLKADDGSALAPDADGLEDEEMDDEPDETLDDADDQTAEEDDVEDDDEANEDEDDDGEPSENVLEPGDADDEVAVGGLRDEALDDPGSDSD